MQPTEFIELPLENIAGVGAVILAVLALSFYSVHRQTKLLLEYLTGKGDDAD